jgi:hypothetical protein
LRTRSMAPEQPPQLMDTLNWYVCDMVRKEGGGFVCLLYPVVFLSVGVTKYEGRWMPGVKWRFVRWRVVR